MDPRLIHEKTSAMHPSLGWETSGSWSEKRLQAAFSFLGLSKTTLDLEFDPF